MILRVAILFSICANAYLATRLFWTDEQADGTVSRSAWRAASSAPLSDANTHPVRNRNSASAQPVVVSVVAPFHWSNLDRSDYRKYVAGLRDIECPEQTIRDIVVADVDRFYRRRVLERVNALTGRYWELVLSAQKLKEMGNQQEEFLEQLEKERKGFLRELLGVVEHGGDYLRPEEARERDLEESRRYFSSLLEFPTTEKVEVVRQAQAKVNTAMEDYVQQFPASTQEQRRLKREELRADAESELRALLTPEEYAEYKLRTSDAANIRERLADMDISADEVRAIAEAGEGPEAEKKIFELLGPERYAMYERSVDGAYQATLRVTERFKLPSETAVRVYEMQQAAQRAAAQLQANIHLTPEQRAARLRDIQVEAEQSVGAALGSRAFAVYRSSMGAWIQNLNPNQE